MAIQFAAQPVVPDPKGRVKQKQTLLPAKDRTVIQPPVIQGGVIRDDGPKKLIAVRLPPDLLAKVDAEAKRLGLNRTQTIIAMLSQKP